MAIDSPFHKKIGDILNDMNLPKVGVSVCLDMACDGNEKGKKSQISLFAGEKGRENILCKVDSILITHENSVNNIKVIIEIEESGFNPTKICGKYFTSALAKSYIDFSGIEIPIACKSILFIQIIDSNNLLKNVKEKNNSKKKEQLINIGKEIKSVLPFGCIKEYEVIFIDSNKPYFSEFISLIKRYLSIDN